MDKKAHKYVVMFVAFFVLIRLIIYFIGDSAQQMSTVFDTMLYSTLLLLITLGPLYKHHLIHLYLSVVTIVFIGFIATEIYNIINAADASEIARTLLTLVIISFLTYHVYYKVPLIVLSKRNQTLYIKVKALKNRTNRCPNCNADLTRGFSKIDDRIEDGYICPYCDAKLGFKRIYSVLGLIAMGLWVLTVLLTSSCTFFENTCTSYNDKYYVAQSILFLIFIITINIKNMYVMKSTK